ncbi:MAG TPA: GNAT family N-acetyltransferase [Gemmataceae bacterium]|nr:GNAT family N-acetyltransferase [Gemmataceae bacterium]
MAFRVREARISDAETIVEFNRRLAEESEDVKLDVAILGPGVSAVLADSSKGRYYVAEENGEVIGQLMITYEWSDWRNGWIWWLQSVYVSADARGKGVFRAILEYTLKQAESENNVVLMRLYVEKENHAAQATYQRLGFEEMHFHLYQRKVN